MKKTIIALIVIVVIGFGGYVLLEKYIGSTPVPVYNTADQNQQANQQASTTVVKKEIKDQEVIGSSVNGLPIVAYHFGTGSSEILLVAGLHGGYEWNTSLLAYQLIGAFKKGVFQIPANARVTIIPVVNPDGLSKVVGTSSAFTASQVHASQATMVAARFNADNVDLNRNFDCDWKDTGVWQNKKVSGGTSAFSEPEAQAVKAYVESNKPVAAITWYSSAGGVYGSKCGGATMDDTKTLASTFGDASGYKAHDSFDFYETSGDMVNWLAKNNIPAISVLLTDHTSTELTKNSAGITAVLKGLAE
jgi:predicted deacylase